jgi:glyoxylase-like metal-dependent hydrolase (beta-lactamase superfamily II)
MREVAPGVHMLGGFPPNAINVYLAGDVLIDAGTRQARNRILRQLRGRPVRAHALTHVHPDHQGASHAVCTELDVPMWVGEDDAPAMEDASIMQARVGTGAATFVQRKLWIGPPHPVERRLHEGDEVAGFTVLEAPGHTPGHVAYWRESDRTLIAGDVFFNLNPLTGRPGLRPPPNAFNADTPTNYESMRRLAGLRPEVVVFGHGPPLRRGDVLQRFVETMPS